MIIPRDTQVTIGFLEHLVSELQQKVLGLPICKPEHRTIGNGEAFKIPEARLLTIQGGSLEVSVRERPIYVLTEGDIAGSWLCDAHITLTATAGRTDTLEYTHANVFAAICTDPALLALWTEILAENSRLMAALYAEHGAVTDAPIPKLVHFDVGAEIVREGELSGSVYSLVEGSADVLVGGVKVGEVNSDEIFGAIAALTGAPRSASMIATAPCVAMSFSKETFSEMLRSHPGLVTKLIEDMARALRDLNSKIVTMSRVRSL